MPTERQLVELVRGLVAEDPGVRDRSADSLTDGARDFSAEDVAVLAYLLAALRISEQNANAQESQLNALAELAERHDLPLGALALLGYVRQETVTGSQREHMDSLSQK